MRVHPSDSLSVQSGLVPTASLESCRFVSRWVSLCKSHRPISERPVTPRVESTKPHSLSEPLAAVITSSQHVYEVRPRKDNRGADLISDALPFGRLWYGEPNAITNAIDYARFYNRSHDAVIRVYDAGVPNPI